MNNENIKTLEYKDDEKSLQKMIDSIKMNYAILLLLKFGKNESG